MRRTSVRRSSHSRLAFVLLFAAAAAVTWLRAPDLYRLPIAAYEDGRDVFGFFYNHREPGSILRFYNGYVSLLPNLAGWLAVRLPTPRVPLALALFPLCTAALAFSWPALPSQRTLIERDGLRWAACLVLALAPVGNYLFVSNTSYSVWTLLFLLVLMSLGEPPGSARGLALQGLAMAALILSHPLSIALLPVYLWRLWRRWGAGMPTRLFHGALAAVAVLYQLAGVEHGGERRLEALEVGRVTVTLVLERVVFNTLASDRLSRILHGRGEADRVLAAAALALAAVAALAIIFRRRFERRHLTRLAILGYLIVALTALYVVGREGTLQILTGNPAYRYFWVQRLCFIVALFVVADAVSGGGGRRPARAALAGLAALAVAAQLAWLNQMDNRKYAARPGMGLKLATFTEEVARQEATGDGAVAARHERGRWSNVLERPPAEGR